MLALNGIEESNFHGFTLGQGPFVILSLNDGWLLSNIVLIQLLCGLRIFVVIDEENASSVLPSCRVLLLLFADAVQAALLLIAATVFRLLGRQRILDADALRNDLENLVLLVWARQWDVCGQGIRDLGSSLIFGSSCWNTDWVQMASVLPIWYAHLGSRCVNIDQLLLQLDLVLASDSLWPDDSSWCTVTMAACIAADSVCNMGTRRMIRKKR